MIKQPLNEQALPPDDKVIYGDMTVLDYARESIVKYLAGRLLSITS